MHEIYCSVETQDVPKVTLVAQDPPGDITTTPLGHSRHRLDKLSLGDKVIVDNNLNQGSNDIPFLGETTV